MIPQDRKYFRFRFSRVLVLMFLLTSPTQVVSLLKSPPVLRAVWAETAIKDLIQNRELQSSIKIIVHTAGEACNDLPPNVRQWFLQKLPQLIKESLPVAKNAGLVLLSVYLLYRSYELYDRAMNLAEREYNNYLGEFEAVQEGMKPVRKFIEKQFIPSWEKGDIANMQKSVETLLRILDRYSPQLSNLIQAVHSHATKAASDKRWSAGYTVGAISTCVGSMFVAPPVAIGFTCAASLFAAALSFQSYCFLENCVPMLDLLLKDSLKLRKEIEKYRVQLELSTL